MNIKYLLLCLFLLLVDLVLIFKIAIGQSNIALFNNKGIIALQEKNLIITYVLLMLLIVIPVVVTGYFIAWKYRASNTKATYTPEAKHSAWSEIRLWLPPIAIVIVMSAITWQATHRLDPYKPLASNNKPLKIQVIALQWKWLFIYPEQKIATVNFVQFPAQTPITFTLTADAPMNSFWIPQLGGQLYAMAGMSQPLNLIADKPGDYRGSTAEISGKGFAGMKFTARATTREAFADWVKQVQNSPQKLDFAAYKQLAKPTEDNPVALYRLSDDNLYNEVIMQFMPSKR